MIARAILVAALLVACGERSAPTPGPAPSPRPSAAPTAAPAPTPAGSARPISGGAGGRGGDNSAAPTVTDAPISIAIVGRGGVASTFSRAQLEALPAATAPIGDTVTKGQSLLDLARAAGLAPSPTPGAALWLADGEGASLSISIAELEAGRVMAMLRINRHGELRLKTYEQVGGAWRVRGDLRGLASIKLHGT